MQNGMIVCPQPEAAEAGAAVLERGGNAVDAAIACAFMQGDGRPLMCGIGGFGSMQLYMPGTGSTRSSSSMPAPRSRRRGRHAGGQAHPCQSRDGFAFAAPRGRISEIRLSRRLHAGSVKGYDFALSRYGTMDWARHHRPGDPSSARRRSGPAAYALVLVAGSEGL